MAVYYNEFDKKKCAALKELMVDGLISAGDIDDRPIQEVKAHEIKGYTRAHFFAGIGLWDYALQLAGWPADRPVWTGSCPCQPFSSAGRQKGKADDRHLWPYWQRLIEECRPPIVFGEQVDSAIRMGWLDDVGDSFEENGYRFASAVIPAVAVGAPHRRYRIWFVGSFKYNNCELPQNEPLFNDDEDLQKMWSGKGFREFREKERLERRAALPLPPVSQRAAQRIPCEKSGAENCVCSEEARREPRNRKAVRKELQAEQQGTLFDSKYQNEGGEEECFIRLGRTRSENTRENKCGALRDDGNTAGFELQQDKEIQYPINRQDCAGEGLYIQQHKDSGLYNERGAGRLGGREAIENNEGMDGEKINEISDIHKSNETIADAKSIQKLDAMGNEENPEGKRVHQVEGVGAPHKRDRLWFVADLQEAERELNGAEQNGKQNGFADSGTLGDAQHNGSPANTVGGSGEASIQHDTQGQNSPGEFEGAGAAGELPASPVADTKRSRSQGQRQLQRPVHTEAHSQGEANRANYASAGNWQDGAWIDCPDGKKRLVEPGIRLLADGYPNRVLQLHCAGDGIVAQVAAKFIEATM